MGRNAPGANQSDLATQLGARHYLFCISNRVLIKSQPAVVYSPSRITNMQRAIPVYRSSHCDYEPAFRPKKGGQAVRFHGRSNFASFRNCVSQKKDRGRLMPLGPSLRPQKGGPSDGLFTEIPNWLRFGIALPSRELASSGQM
jgi:hypothetical protein